VLTVTDDGSGFDPGRTVTGSGLANIRDRVDSAGGTLEVTSAPGQGTRLRVLVPAPVVAAAEGRG